MRAVVAAVGVASAVCVSACTSSGAPGSPAGSTRVTTIVSTVTRTAATLPPATGPAFTPAPTVHPLPPGAAPRRGEVERTCPYLRAGLNVEPTGGPNVADIEGDRVYRRTVLTALTPVGCRFYFYAPPYEAVADIVPRTYPSAAAARAALAGVVRTAPAAEARPGFVAGVDGVRFRTRFFGPDGERDWAFAFAKGRVLVVVRTQQTNVSVNAEQLARAVVGRF